MRIAFAGNPNSGKTTMYNALTGRNEKVGNWAGVTVDKKEAPIKKAYAGDLELIAVDLPGAYSMSPFTSEESITSGYVKNEHPDVIINIVDATNLSRSLFFTTQLLELGVPVVVALNKHDINEKKDTKIDANALSEKLGCPVFDTTSTTGDGLKEIVQAAVALIGKTQKAPYNQGHVDLTDKASVDVADRKRFAFVNKIVSKVETRKVLTKDRNYQDKIDAVLTHPLAGIPIFAIVMFLVFQISQSWLGVWIAEGLELGNVADGGLAGFLGGWDWYAGHFVDEEGLAILPGLVTWVDMFGEWVGGLMTDANPLISSILVDGIIGGFSAVIGFLPLVMVMYFMIALLEDCGYMARATVVLDPIFKKVGLSGKSVIPFVIGTGCAIPGVMACRTIRNERERRATAMLAPFMPCGAKLPVIALFAGAFFPGQGWVGTMMYFVGILIILLGALLVNKIAGHKNRKSFFIMELPEYKAPSVKRAFSSMCARGWSYIVKAGTIILLCNFVVHLLQSFTWEFAFIDYGAIEEEFAIIAEQLNATLSGAELESALAINNAALREAMTAAANTSILKSIASPFGYLLMPVIGVAAWQFAAAAVTGFIAKENVVGTVAICYGITNLIGTESLEMAEGSGTEIAAIIGITKVAALAYLMFNLFSPPCFAAIGAMNAEIKDKKWLWGGIGLQLGIGYTVGYLVYTIGSLIVGDPLNVTAAIGGGLFVAVFAGILIYLCAHADKKVKAEYALSGK